MASDIYTVSLHDALPISIDTMTAVLRDDLPPLTESGARVPYELDRIVHRCVEKKPAARFQSARDLAFALRRSEEHTSELQSQSNLVCRLLLEKKKYRACI